ncbi:membrane protein [Moritella sp. JT01]|uniref:YqhA family protein n=1 Tax=Moritella sp. JT01 TaxID=756698 RepID=UPI00079A451D|nr:YqhA family protein [Moritella sp. JT01]KXO12695.1 membrane protein [Moritella sp. JT01]
MKNHSVKRMKDIFFIFRFISWIAIICSLFGSLLLFVVGAIKTYYAFTAVAFGYIPDETLAHLDSADIATAYLIKGLDTFLIALVLFIFAHGVFTLFITDKKLNNIPTVLSWIKTPDIGHLKNILGEVIVIILFVKFLEMILINLNDLSWEILILPISILLLALALKFLDLNDKNSSHKDE